MSSLDSYTSLAAYSPFSPLTTFIILTVLISYTFLMRSHFNTLRPGLALKQEKERNILEERYRGIFERREEVVHHVAWAKQRGDQAEEEVMKKKCVTIDKEIDELETRINKIYKSHGVRAKSS
ncbi:hypothetical protein TrLO_g8458 [Triparma laevis f. longispina]|uniref:Uncharacterized protein n=1 Tax=Triparma laevis f. longispina TaxID=1714387 RepID=A0A9W7BZF4_9STRA|nr:hypothetical protein TrLO_g8458 [Triparma laevis f. longispina]